MLGHPGVHGNRRRSASIDRSSRAKLGDMQDHLASRLHLIAQPGPSWPNTRTHARGIRNPSIGWEPGTLSTPSSGMPLPPPSARAQATKAATSCGGFRVVAVGDHGAATIPATLSDDVKGLGIERICRADHRPDVEVVPQFPRRRGNRVVGCRGPRRSPRAASSGSGPRHYGDHPRPRAPGRSGAGHAPAHGPTPTGSTIGVADAAAPASRLHVCTPSFRQRAGRGTDGCARVAGRRGPAPAAPSRRSVPRRGNRRGRRPAGRIPSRGC